MTKRGRVFVGSFVTSSLLLSASSRYFLADAADDRATATTPRLRRSTHDNRRRLVSKRDNIFDIIDSIYDRGHDVDEPSLSFDIETEDEDTNTIMLHLDKVTSAVTPATALNFLDGAYSTNDVDASKFTFLVSNSTLTTDLTVVSVNTHSGEVNGLQQQRESGQIRNISPKNNSSNPTLQLRKASLSSSEPRSFECASEHGGDRHRHEDHSHDGGHEDHSHDGVEGFHRHDHHNLRRKVTENNSKHSGFQIDLIIDIDRELIKRNRSIEKAVEFVNFIVTTTNVILEKEFDLHLNVVEISETTIFDSNGVGSTKEAIKLYRQTFKDTIGNDKAHLRHALLGRDLGGGIAYSDSVCDPAWGFGISSGLKGKINSIDMYDIYLFAHELGHNFGSGHMFDDDYMPPVDTCEQNKCPEGLPLEASSTLMSYCGYFCGDVTNIAFTYGGQCMSSREDLSSWIRNPAIVDSPISTDPQRVSHLIWKKLAAKEECIAKRDPLSVPPLAELTSLESTKSPSPTLNPTVSAEPSTSSSPTLIPTTSPKPTVSPPPTLSPSSTPTGSPSAKPSAFPSSSPIASPSMRPSISRSEMPSTSPTKGMHSITPLKQCDSNCEKTNSYMFNVKLQNNAKNDIEIHSISFRHKAPESHRVARVYIIEGGYEGNEQSMDGWKELGSGRVPKQNNFLSQVTLDSPFKIKAGEKYGFHLQTEENILTAGRFGKEETIDERKVMLQHGLAVINEKQLNGYLWTGSVDYMLLD